jgi:ribonuclease HII
LLIDGNRFIPYSSIPHHCIIKGDGKYLNIAAASILAKTYRDEYMDQIAEEFPEYSWKQNKGYPTKAHREAIQKFGPTKFHRMSFTLLAPEQLSLFD